MVSEQQKWNKSELQVCWYFFEYKIGNERTDELKARPMQPNVEEIWILSGPLKVKKQKQKKEINYLCMGMNVYSFVSR